MTDVATVWLCTLPLPVYRCGGWAFVSAQRGEKVGVAGGVRQTTAPRLVLVGLAAALESARGAAPETGVVDIVTSTSETKILTDILSTLATMDLAALADSDRDLWAAVVKASAGRRVRLSPLSSRPSAATTFVAAWAELASSKAKAAGPFKAAIPRANLAKVAFL